MPDHHCARASFFCALCVLVSVVCSTLSAQAPATGSITGHVRGPGAVSVPAATVQITNPQTGERKETWTDEDGNFSFTGLPPGTYRLTLSLVGFRSDVREPIPVTANQVLKINFAMVLAVPGEEPAPASAQRTAPAQQSTQRPNPSLAAGHAAAGPSRGQRANGSQGSFGEGTADEESLLRFADNGGAENTAAAAQSEPENSDTSASAANSFLLAGGVGDAATPGEGRGGRRGMRGGGMGFGDGAGGFGGGPGGMQGGPGARVASGAAVQAAEAAGLAGVAVGLAVGAVGEAVVHAAGAAIAPR